MTSYTKFELNPLRNNEITMKVQITDIFGCRDKVEVWNDVIYTMTMASWIILLNLKNLGLFAPSPQYKLGSQSAPYRLG